MPKPKVECYFEGEMFWAAFDAQRAEYAGPDAIFKILKQGKKFYVQFCGADGEGGDPINDSVQCPGNPRC
jgi:hypothetical protein